MDEESLFHMLVSCELNRMSECEPGFYCPDMQVYTPQIIPYPSFNVRRKRGTDNIYRVKNVRFRRDSDSYDMASSHMSQLRVNECDIDCRSLSRIPHTLTFKLMDFHEEELRNLGHFNDDCDNMTPDLMVSDHGCHLLMEFGTYHGDLRKASNYYESKRVKYANPISNRSKGITAFYIIVVTQNNVVTNHPLMTDNIAAILTMLYRMSLDIVGRIRSSAGITENDADLDGYISYWDSHLGDIHPTFTGKSKIMTKSHYMFCKQLNNGHIAIDKSKVDNTFRYAWAQSKDQIISHFGNTRESYETNTQVRRAAAEERIKHWLEDDDQGYVLRYDMKPLLIHPLILMNSFDSDHPYAYKLEHPKKLSTMPVGDLSSTPLSRLWCSVMGQLQADDYMTDVDNESLEDVFTDMSKTKEELAELSIHYKMYRSRYHRIKPKITDDDLFSLAESGLKAKRYKDDNTMKELKAKQKRRFSNLTDTSDIDDFIKYGSGYLTEKLPITSENLMVTTLLEDAYRQHHKNEGSVKETSASFITELKEYQTMRVSVAFRIIGEISHEVSIAMRQFCKSDEFIIKRLARFPIWLLISSVGLGKPVFYSCFFFKEDLFECNTPSYMSKIFREVKTNGVVCWTEFMSAVEPKLVNPVKANEMAMIYYRSMQSISGGSLGTPTLTGVHGSHYALSLLLFLHNKQSACDAATNTRYIFMESNVSYPRIPDPLKMLEKYNRNPLSRLELFLNRRITTYMLHTINHPVEEQEGFWRNLVSWITLEPLSSPRQAVNYCYHGYTANKQKHLEPLNLSKVCEAVTEKEVEFQENLALPDGLIGHGHGDKESCNLKFSEFQRSFYLDCVDTMRRHLMRVQGPEWRNNLFKSYMSEIMELSVDGLATLKATSVADASWRTIREDKYHREKILTEIYKMSKSLNTSVVLKMVDHSMKMMQDQDTMYICIFPKDQISGIREIYVMRLESRLCQKLIERFSETLCENFPNEIITHPENKFKIIHAHRQKLAKCPSYVTMGTSADKRKWNHGHTAAKFMMGLSPFVDSCMFDFFYSVMQMWEKRLILAPQKLIDVIRTKETLNTNSEPVIALHDAIVMNNSNELVDAGTQMFKIQHGFMQGILHFTSSVEHGRFLMKYTAFARSIIKTLKKKRVIASRCKFVIDSMYSSDDSGLLMSLSDDGTESMKDKHRIILAAIGESMRSLGTAVGMYESPKSTFHTENRLEFNSRFMFGSSIEEPVLRQVNSTVHITNCESMIGRLEENYGVLEGVLENGGEFWLLAHIQLAQALFHYRLLGSDVNRYSNRHFRFLCSVPDPALGYFPLDNPLCTSVMGMRYNYYVLSFNKPLSSKYKFLLVSSENSTRNRTIALGLSSQSAIVGTSSVVFSNRDRARNAFLQSGLPTNWRETLENQPSFMFRKTQDTEIIAAKLSMKMHQPGVITKYGSSVSTFMSPLRAAVYIIQRLVLIDKDYDLIQEDEEWSRHKISLLMSQQDYVCYNNDMIFRGMIGHDQMTLTDEDRLVIFPSSKDYFRSSQQLKLMSHRNFSHATQRDARKRSKLVVLEKSNDINVSFRRTVEFLWGLEIFQRSELKRMENAVSYYKKRFDWLNDTLESSFGVSPFRDRISMCQFIIQYKHDSRILQASTPPLKTNYGVAGLLEVVAMNTVHGRKLLELTAEEAPVLHEVTTTEQALHETYAIVSSPFNENYKRQAIFAMMQQIPEIQFDQNERESRKNRLAIIQLYCRAISMKNSRDWAEQMQSEDLLHQLAERVISMRPDHIGVWTVRQRRVGRLWLGNGEWKGRLHNIPIIIRVTSERNETVLREIIISERNNVMELLPWLNNWCKQNRVEAKGIRQQQVTRQHVRTDKNQLNRDGTILWIIDRQLDIGLHGDVHNMITQHTADFELNVMSDRVKILHLSETICALDLRRRDYNYHAYEKRFRIPGPNNLSEDFLLSWMSNETVVIDQLATIMEFEPETVVGRRGSFTDFTKWCRNYLKLCLMENGLLEREGDFIRHVLQSTSHSSPDEDTNWDEINDLDLDFAMEFEEINTNEIDIDADLDLIEQVNAELQETPSSMINTCVINLLSRHFGCRKHWYDIVMNRVWCETVESEVNLARIMAQIEESTLPSWGSPIQRRVKLRPANLRSGAPSSPKNIYIPPPRQLDNDE